MRNLRRLTDLLEDCDRRPIGLDRIPYSAPGRWIQQFDFSELPCPALNEALKVDTFITRLFPLTPFLTTINVGGAIRLSRRAIEALADSDCARILRHLTGIQPPMPFWFYHEELQLFEDPLIKLLSRTPALRHLGLRGPDYEDETSHSTVFGEPVQFRLTY